MSTKTLKMTDSFDLATAGFKVEKQTEKAVLISRPSKVITAKVTSKEEIPFTLEESCWFPLALVKLEDKKILVPAHRIAEMNTKLSWRRV